MRIEKMEPLPQLEGDKKIEREKKETTGEVKKNIDIEDFRESKEFLLARKNLIENKENLPKDDKKFVDKLEKKYNEKGMPPAREEAFKYAKEELNSSNSNKKNHFINILRNEEAYLKNAKFIKENSTFKEINKGTSRYTAPTKFYIGNIINTLKNSIKIDGNLSNREKIENYIFNNILEEYSNLGNSAGNSKDGVYKKSL